MPRTALLALGALAAITPAQSAPTKAPPAAATADARDLLFTLRTDDGIELTAKLSLPAGERPAPVVLYLHGAGPRTYDNTFRFREADGSIGRANYLDFHARQLTERGAAFCRINKRGCTPTDTGPGMEIDGEVFAGATPKVLLADYARTLAALRERPEIDPDRVALIGSSEGTWMASRLANLDPKGIVAIAMYGYAEDNAEDTVVWQRTVGPWRNIQHLIPAARDGALTRAEYDAAVAESPLLARQLPFEAIDKDANGSLNATDLSEINRPGLDATRKAMDTGDDALLGKVLPNFTTAYLRDWWTAAPNHTHLLTLDVPLAIFHGELDGTCRVEGVHETAAAFRRADKGNLSVHLYPTADHGLDWTHTAASKGGPPAFLDMFDFVARHLRRSAK